MVPCYTNEAFPRTVRQATGQRSRSISSIGGSKVGLQRREVPLCSVVLLSIVRKEEDINRGGCPLPHLPVPCWHRSCFSTTYPTLSGKPFDLSPNPHSPVSFIMSKALPAVQSHLYIVALFTVSLLLFVTASGAAPITPKSDNTVLSDRDFGGNTNAGARVGRVKVVPKRSPSAAIVKHVKPACEGPICNHAAFYDH